MNIVQIYFVETVSEELPSVCEGLLYWPESSYNDEWLKNRRITKPVFLDLVDSYGGAYADHKIEYNLLTG